MIRCEYFWKMVKESFTRLCVLHLDTRLTSNARVE